jgi:hypothetical protein
LGQRLNAMNPLRTCRINFSSSGDPEKKRRILLHAVKIYHVIISASIPLALIALTVILPWKDIGTQIKTDADISAAIFLFYVFSIIAMIAGYKWSSVYKWLDKHINRFNRFTFDDYVWALFNSHLSRIGNFWVVIGAAFFCGIIGNGWYIGLPLFTLAGVALILTYPTDKKWARWLSDMRQEHSSFE